MAVILLNSGRSADTFNESGIMKLTRHSKDPVLEPRRDHPWEKDAVLNTAVVYNDGKFHLLYRAVAHNPDDFNRSSIGYAWSSDGLNFDRLPQPVLAPGEAAEESKGVEDPRVTPLNDAYYMCYTAWNGKHSQVGLATSTDLRHWTRQGIMLKYSMFGHNKNAALFASKIDGRYALLHRPMGFGNFFELPADIPMNIMLSFSDDLWNWTDHRILMDVRPGMWDERKIGIAGPPIFTPQGWLLVYHGVDFQTTYRLGIALLDLDDPTKVIRRQREPILEPLTEWEVKGDVPNVVFSCGAVLLDDELWVYYGGADTVIGLARGSVREFLHG